MTVLILLRRLTRSVGVICLSQYLQVTLTGYETLKHSNHLSINYLYRDRDKALAHRDRKYCAILACHRDSSLPTNGTRNRLAAPVTQTPSTAVPLAFRPRCDTKSLYITVNHCIMTTFYNSS